MDKEKINIGALIDKRRNELDLSIRDFADKIHVSVGNAYDILKRESIDMALLQRISSALNYDFFKLYVNVDESNDDEYIYIMVKVKKDDLIKGDICRNCKYFNSKFLL